MKRSMFQNQTKTKTTKRYRFRERMLFQISRIWIFRIFINRRVLIDCRLENEKLIDKSLTHRRLTKNYEKDEFVWLSNKFNRSIFFSYSCHCFRIVYVKNSFLDVDCKNVKNRTHTFWNRFSQFIKNFIETNSLVVVTNSLNVIETDRLLKLTKRNVIQKFFV